MKPERVTRVLSLRGDWIEVSLPVGVNRERYTAWLLSDEAARSFDEHAGYAARQQQQAERRCGRWTTRHVSGYELYQGAETPGGYLLLTAFFQYILEDEGGPSPVATCARVQATLDGRLVQPWQDAKAAAEAAGLHTDFRPVEGHGDD